MKIEPDFNPFPKWLIQHKNGFLILWAFLYIGIPLFVVILVTLVNCALAWYRSP